MQLEHEKGRGRDPRARSITIPPGAVPGLEELLAKWERCRGAVESGASYYRLPGESASRLPSSAVDTWLRLVLAHFDMAPPAHEAWSGHSLRKGAASAAAAVGVDLHRICYVGGWKIRSAAVLDYIDPTCPSTPAARRFFGWLSPHV